jgi:hypothetical protein
LISSGAGVSILSATVSSGGAVLVTAQGAAQSGGMRPSDQAAPLPERRRSGVVVRFWFPRAGKYRAASSSRAARR